MADLGVRGECGFRLGVLVVPADVVADGGVLVGVAAVDPLQPLTLGHRHLPDEHFRASAHRPPPPTQ